MMRVRGAMRVRAMALFFAFMTFVNMCHSGRLLSRKTPTSPPPKRSPPLPPRSDNKTKTKTTVVDNSYLVLSNLTTVSVRFNNIRALHNVSNVALTSNTKMQSTTDNWALQMAQYDSFTHSTNSYYENLASFHHTNLYNDLEDCTPYIIKSIDAWYSELPLYQAKNSTAWSKDTGHVWALLLPTLKQFSIACSVSAQRLIYVVMNFA